MESIDTAISREEDLNYHCLSRPLQDPNPRVVTMSTPTYTSSINHPSGSEASSHQKGNGDRGADSRVIVLGTPSGEVTWRRRSESDSRLTYDQDPIPPGRPDTRFSEIVRGPGGQGKSFEGGIFSSIPRGDLTISTGYVSGGRDFISSCAPGINGGRRYSDSLNNRGYARGEDCGLLGASRYQSLDSQIPQAGVGLRDLPGNMDVRETSADIPPNYTHFAARPVENHNVKLPTYDGKTDLFSYLTQFELISELNNWSSEKKAIQLAVSLSGNAAQILNDIPFGSLRDYNMIKQCLIDRFQPQNQRKLHVAKLRARTRRRNETLEDLAHDIKNMVRLAYPDLDMKCREDMALECFADAINDEQLRRDLIVGGPKTMSEAIRLATEAELSYSRKGVFARQIYDDTLEPILQRINQLEMANDTRINNIERPQSKLVTNSYRNENNQENMKKKKGVCFKCGSPDHFKKYCPFVCDLKNHPYNKYHNPQFTRYNSNYQSAYQNDRSNQPKKQNIQGNFL